jgi:hypothetical protein
MCSQYVMLNIILRFMLFLNTLLPERDGCCRYIDTGIVFCRTLLLEILELDRERLVISLASTDALQANLRQCYLEKVFHGGASTYGLKLQALVWYLSLLVLIGFISVSWCPSPLQCSHFLCLDVEKNMFVKHVHGLSSEENRWFPVQVMGHRWS